VASDIKRRRFAHGPPRPKYLGSADADKAVMMMLALAAEVSALRERVDTHERLAEGNHLPATPSVEAYVPTEAVAAARASARRSMIDRITRVLLETEPSPRQAANTAADPQDQRVASPEAESQDQQSANPAAARQDRRAANPAAARHDQQTVNPGAGPRDQQAADAAAEPRDQRVASPEAESQDQQSANPAAAPQDGAD
jgi:hypothetical protein